MGQLGNILLLLLIVCLVLIAGVSYWLFQKNVPVPVPVKRLDSLQRGVDISLWFRFPLSETDDYYSNYISDDDLNFIHNSQLF